MFTKPSIRTLLDIVQVIRSQYMAVSEVSGSVASQYELEADCDTQTLAKPWLLLVVTVYVHCGALQAGLSCSRHIFSTRYWPIHLNEVTDFLNAKPQVPKSPSHMYVIVNAQEPCTFTNQREGAQAQHLVGC